MHEVLLSYFKLKKVMVNNSSNFTNPFFKMLTTLTVNDML